MADRPGSEFTLTLSCVDRPGIVAAVASYLVEHGANILESQQFDDRGAQMFFMRVRFESASETPLHLGTLREDFSSEVAGQFAMTWRLLDASDRQKVMILVSKHGHCLNDLLFRAANGDLHIGVTAIVSNHPDLAAMADQYHIPFHHLPVTPQTKQEAEGELLSLVDELDVDLVVLARYMQVLSDDACKRLEGRAINIHHSILPSFKGAKPYNQAHERGVKLVGATAHYVTADLDEGPIIEQEVARINHSMTAEQVTALGRDNECLALSRAVRWHTENRVLLNRGRTVVLH